MCRRYNVAVGDGTDADGARLHFNTNRGNGQALSPAGAAKALAKGDALQSVSIASVDGILASSRFAFKRCLTSVCNRFFVMKIDVEGFELRALRGASLLLKAAAPPLIMIELAPGTIKGARALAAFPLCFVTVLHRCNCRLPLCFVTILHCCNRRRSLQGLTGPTHLNS